MCVCVYKNDTIPDDVYDPENPRGQYCVISLVTVCGIDSHKGCVVNAWIPATIVTRIDLCTIRKRHVATLWPPFVRLFRRRFSEIRSNRNGARFCPSCRRGRVPSKTNRVLPERRCGRVKPPTVSRHYTRCAHSMQNGPVLLPTKIPLGLLCTCMSPGFTSRLAVSLWRQTESYYRHNYRLALLRFFKNVRIYKTIQSKTIFYENSFSPRLLGETAGPHDGQLGGSQPG